MKQQLQSNAGNDANKVQVDMKTTVMKELGVNWLTALYDYLRGRPKILVKNGFKEAGIVEALQQPCEEETDENLWLYVLSFSFWW